MADSSRPLRVLVVDDEQIIANTLAAILRHHDYDASAVYSAEDALDWCRKRAPDVAISDVFMGPINGVQLALQLEEKFPDCKVLLISGHAHISGRLLGPDSSGDHFTLFDKPVRPQRILDFLATVQRSKPHTTCSRAAARPVPESRLWAHRG
jgi:DNA-binding NtrC family response regulator